MLLSHADHISCRFSDVRLSRYTQPHEIEHRTKTMNNAGMGLHEERHCMSSVWITRRANVYQTRARHYMICRCYFDYVSVTYFWVQHFASLFGNIFELTPFTFVPVVCSCLTLICGFLLLASANNRRLEPVPRRALALWSVSKLRVLWSWTVLEFERAFGFKVL